MQFTWRPAVKIPRKQNGGIMVGFPSLLWTRCLPTDTPWMCVGVDWNQFSWWGGAKHFILKPSWFTLDQKRSKSNLSWFGGRGEATFVTPGWFTPDQKYQEQTSLVGWLVPPPPWKLIQVGFGANQWKKENDQLPISFQISQPVVGHGLLDLWSHVCWKRVISCPFPLLSGMKRESQVFNTLTVL